MCVALLVAGRTRGRPRLRDRGPCTSGHGRDVPVRRGAHVRCRAGASVPGGHRHRHAPRGMPAARQLHGPRQPRPGRRWFGSHPRWPASRIPPTAVTTALGPNRPEPPPGAPDHSPFRSPVDEGDSRPPVVAPRHPHDDRGTRCVPCGVGAFPDTTLLLLQPGPVAPSEPPRGAPRAKGAGGEALGAGRRGHSSPTARLARSPTSVSGARRSDRRSCGCPAPARPWRSPRRRGPAWQDR